MEQRTRRIIAWSIVGVVVVAAGVIGGVLWWLKSDQARPVAVDDVLADFRASASSTTTTTAAGADTTPGSADTTMPPATSDGSATSAAADTTVAATSTTQPAALPIGVYVYTTTGDEGVDALGGDEHPYPATTTMTVTNSGEGCVMIRWDALEQRWDQAQYCWQADGWHLTARTTFHSFFQQSDERGFTCTPQSLQLPADPAAGATFTASCDSPGTGQSGASGEDITGTVVGFEQLQVGDEMVDTVHVKYDTAITGQSAGDDTVERWYARDAPMLLVREVRSGVTNSETAVGTVRYDEQYELMLQDLAPLS